MALTPRVPMLVEHRCWQCGRVVARYLPPVGRLELRCPHRRCRALNVIATRAQRVA